MNKILIIFLSVALISISCVSNNNTIEDRKWYLQEIEGDTDIIVLNEKEPYIEFDLESSKISGNASCNNFFTDYTLLDNSISIGKIATTLMICPDDTNQEYRFLQALSRVDSFQIIDGKLYLYELESAILILHSK